MFLKVLNLKVTDHLGHLAQIKVLALLETFFDRQGAGLADVLFGVEEEQF